jgi:hypothetical protein
LENVHASGRISADVIGKKYDEGKKKAGNVKEKESGKKKKKLEIRAEQMQNREEWRGKGRAP